MVLKIDNLTKKYRNGRGIDSVSFDVDDGDIFGLLGPNGSDKTTTMKIIVGLIKPDSGNVEIFSKSAEDNPEEYLKDIGCLIEAPAIYEYLSARKNLEMVASYYNNIKASRIEEILSLTGLLKYQNEKVREFSLGMKQRLGLALALISDPKFVILDEPTNGYIEGIVSIREIIIKENKEKGTTFLISSHLAHELEVIWNKIAIMKKVHLLKIATIEEVQKSGGLESYFMKAIGNDEGEVL